MEAVEIGQRRPERQRQYGVLPEQLPLLWDEAQEVMDSGQAPPRAASERDAVIARETRLVRAVVLTLFGAILLASHFL